MMRLEDKYPELYGALQEYIGKHIIFNTLSEKTVCFEERCDNLEEDLLENFAGFGGFDESVLEPDYAPRYQTKQKSSLCPGASPIAPGDMPDFPGLVKDKKTFTDVLMEHIKKSGMSNVQIYNDACMSRQSYSKIVYGSVIPKKTSILALAIALKLSIDETEDLLKRAGHSLVEADLADTIVSYFIENETYDIYIINEFLEHYQQRLLGNVVR